MRQGKSLPIPRVRFDPGFPIGINQRKKMENIDHQRIGGVEPAITQSGVCQRKGLVKQLFRFAIPAPGAQYDGEAVKRFGHQ